MTEHGWYAAVDRDKARLDMDDWKWRPYFQLDLGSPGLGVWFETEAECVDFIRRELVGARLIEDE